MAVTTNVLSPEQIQKYLTDGLLVVDHVLNDAEIHEANQGLSQTLAEHGVNSNDLLSTGLALQTLSSTNGSGGVLDLFYDEWKLKIALNAKLFQITTALWEAAHCHKGEEKSQLRSDETYKWHPFGPFDCTRGYCYIDRIGYRLPNALSEALGTDKGKKRQPLQRSLTPHLDCCPDTFHSVKDAAKWRPIQCFVSLTDALEPNTGGLEVAKGFHREFEQWTKTRPPTVIRKKNGETISFPAPCIGQYTHIRPVEDREVMKRIQHVPVRAGSAVFWDNRLPHANAYRHDGSVPRAVVYCSFLPDIEINRKYARSQLERWNAGRQPTDQWVNETERAGTKRDSYLQCFGKFDSTQRKLLGIDPW